MRPASGGIFSEACVLTNEDTRGMGCGGDERIKKPDGAQVKGESNTLHPTQKPEAVIRHLMDAITVSGDTVFDGFSGVGTTAAVAKKSGRRFIGFEMDLAYFTAAKIRLA